MKCATCGHSWFVGPEGAKQGEASLGAHETYRLKVRERRRRKSRNAAFSAWTATAAALPLVILTGLVCSAAKWSSAGPNRPAPMRCIGMPVNRFGLEFLETEAERFFDGTTPILEVRGAVRNTAGRTVTAPNVRVHPAR